MAQIGDKEKKIQDNGAVGDEKIPSNGICEKCGTPLDRKESFFRVDYDKETNNADIFEMVYDGEEGKFGPRYRMFFRKTIHHFL